jgi:hypothetical protein
LGFSSAAWTETTAMQATANDNMIRFINLLLDNKNRKPPAQEHSTLDRIAGVGTETALPKAGFLWGAITETHWNSWMEEKPVWARG